MARRRLSLVVVVALVVAFGTGPPPATAQTVAPGSSVDQLPPNPLTPAPAVPPPSPAQPPPPVPAAGGLGCDSGGGVSGLVSGSVCSAANTVLGGLVGWVVESTLALINRVAGFLGASSQPLLRSEWFGRQYRVMGQIALVTSLPLLLAATIDGLIRRRTGEIVKAAFVSLPVAAVATAVAIPMIALFVEITDWLAAAVAAGVAQDAGVFLERVGGLFRPADPASGVLPPFILLVAALLGLVAAFVVWLELLLRELAIYLVAFFFPLSAATLIWQRVGRWCSRCLRTLAAVILSKFFIVAVISLGAAALSAAGTALAPPPPSGAASAASAGFETVMAGVALLLLATFAPWVCFRLLAPVEGAATDALQGAATGAAAGLAGRVLGSASSGAGRPPSGGMDGTADGAPARRGSGSATSRVSPAQANAAAAAAALPLAGVRSAGRAGGEVTQAGARPPQTSGARGRAEAQQGGSSE